MGFSIFFPDIICLDRPFNKATFIFEKIFFDSVMVVSVLTPAYQYIACLP